MRDEVFRSPRCQIVDFVFDETVAAAFPGHDSALRAGL